jgi:phosphatidylglycerol:prolipoprotein diacylglycerol transferase
MRSTLFLIPHEIAGIPIFGFGWLLMAWLVLGGVMLGVLLRRQGWSREAAGYVPFLAIVAALIVLASRLEITDSQGQPLGIPVRGFGVMMALAIVAAAGLALHRARRMGIDPDTIYSLAMWMIIPGLVGARLFYIIQYWDEFRQPTLAQTLLAAINVTSGGLVVYGSVIGGLPFGIYYLVSRGLPVMAIGDMIAPSMVVGLALGRVGCFLNGCCYGGLCEGPLGVTFPPGSPPHVRHQARGWLYGLRLAADQRGVVIEHVVPGSAADEAGVRAGQHVATIRDEPVASLEDATALLAAAGQEFSLTTHEGKSYAIAAQAWPVRSLPVHPTQLYAALDAALLAAFLWFYYPFRTRDGEVIAILFTLHPVSRFLIEMIRDDEPGQFGTSLTISQWLSLAFLLAAAALWWHVLRQPRGSRLPHAALAADRDS